MASDLPFSRRVVAAEVPPEGSTLRIEADADERAALARLLDVPQISTFSAEFMIRPWGKGGLDVEGTVAATLTRICVVSLDPFETALCEQVEARYVAGIGRSPAPVAPEPKPPPRGSHAADLDAPDELTDGKADLGALAVEFAALGLDPYPRKPEAELEAGAAGEADLRDGPFAALAGLAGGGGGPKP